MEILTLKEAAAFLKKSAEATRREAVKGKIPAAKVFGSWKFVKEDLVEYVRSHYSNAAKTSWGVVKAKRKTTWHSTEETIYGGLTSATVEKDYRELLERKIK